MRPEPLFVSGMLDEHLDLLRQGLKEEVWTAPEDYLLNTDIEEWSKYLEARYSLNVPELARDGLYAEDQGEMQIDIRHEGHMRAISDYSRPALVVGRRVALRVPFTGDPHAFKLRPSTFSHNPPSAAILQGEVEILFEYPTDVERPNLKVQANQVFHTIDSWLAWARSDAEPHNSSLVAEARQMITVRREKVLADHSHLDGLGIPVRRRGDAPKTYAAPGISRRPSPARPQSAPKPEPMEPTMVASLFEHALSVTRSMARAMERTPADYATLPEERLRDHLLVMLNTHYAGQGQAEAFNKGGKTDILIRIEDRNVFIAECKIWKGVQSFTDALAQLFGYSTWRDTKLALVIFVPQKQLGRIITEARAALEVHPDFIRWVDTEEGELRCEMRWDGDDDRHADLAILFVHLPRD